MKTYLVACYLGAGVIHSYTVEMPEEYTPISDNMKALKEKIVKEKDPRWCSSHAAPSGCGGYISISESNSPMNPENLDIIAISRLDV